MIANSLISLAISPILLAEGLITRFRVPRWKEPAGERQGRAGTGPPLRMLILGDSAAAGVGADHQDEALSGQLVSRLAGAFSVEWELDAVSGATTASTIRRLGDKAKSRFDVVVTTLGVNDVVSHVRPARWLAQQAELRRMLEERFGARLLVISGLAPMHGFPALPQPLRWHLGWYATALDGYLKADLAGEKNVFFLSLRFSDDLTAMSGDGFHPGPKIYAEWGRRAAEVIEPWAKARQITAA